MEKEFIAHWCVNSKTSTEDAWRPYSTVLCSLCQGEIESTNVVFSTIGAYDKMIERNGKDDILRDGWRN